jgi:hypothetical protein
MRIAFDHWMDSAGFLHPLEREALFHLMEREGFLVPPKPPGGEGGSRASTC